MSKKCLDKRSRHFLTGHHTWTPHKHIINNSHKQRSPPTELIVRTAKHRATSLSFTQKPRMQEKWGSDATWVHGNNKAKRDHSSNPSHSHWMTLPTLTNIIKSTEKESAQIDGNVYRSDWPECRTYRHPIQTRANVATKKKNHEHVVHSSDFWGGWWGSNPRQQESQSWTLPTELQPP